jgi:hypothetical protein
MSSRILRCYFVLFLFGWVAVEMPALAAPPTFAAENHRLIMANSFVYLEFDETHPAIDVLKSDFSGQGHYGGNLLATNQSTGVGIILETIGPDGMVHRSSEVHSSVSYKILQQDPNELCIRIEGLRDQKFRPTVTGVWTLKLTANSRKFTLDAQIAVSHSRSLKAIGIGAYLNQWFMNGLFRSGVMQYVNCSDQSFFTANPLHAFYTMDSQNGSVAIVPNSFPNSTTWVMHSCDAGKGVGLEIIFVGNYPIMEQWHKADWKSAPNIEPCMSAEFEISEDIFPNDYSFPVSSIPVDGPMPFRDLATLYTTIYGSAAGVLGTFNHDGRAYPTLATPKWAYGHLYTFFDPDSWSTVNTLSFSGDPYLQEQARHIVELAGSNINHGQIPHHFVDGEPTYIAISKATQTGPNIFWVLAAIDYATATGNETWLKEHYSQLKAATDWVLDCYDPDRKLVKVGGPLFIDVFIRQGYTLDSNAMLLHLLPLMASVAQFCGDETSTARYSNLADAIKQGLNAGLWDSKDHYVTQRNPDWFSRDMVDYDGNFAAIAFGATTNQEQIAVMYRRFDGGAHTHPGNRGTWTSEKYYGPQDCFGENTGDSATAMARIWWLDLSSRYVTGDVTNFYRYFEPVQGDLLQHTWLTERYNAEGKLIRAPYYHEYPEITAMVLREMIYGIDVKIDHVRIRPFGLSSYHYRMGDIDVSYSQQFVNLHIPGHNARTYEIFGLFPATVYNVSTGQKIITDKDGTARFQAPVGVIIHLTLSR